MLEPPHIHSPPTSLHEFNIPHIRKAEVSQSLHLGTIPRLYFTPSSSSLFNILTSTFIHHSLSPPLAFILISFSLSLNWLLLIIPYFLPFLFPKTELHSRHSFQTSLLTPNTLLQQPLTSQDWNLTSLLNFPPLFERCKFQADFATFGINSCLQLQYFSAVWCFEAFSQISN